MTRRNKMIFVGVTSVILILIISAVFRILAARQKYVIVSATNYAPTQKADIFQPITLVLSRPIIDSFFKTCSDTVSPDVGGQLGYKDSSLMFAPSPAFALNTTYKVSITCRDFTYELSFTTQSENELSPKSIQNLQTVKDRQFSQDVQKAYADRPWLAKTPITKPEYVLVYDSINNQYLVKTTLSPGSKLTQADVQQEIVKDLQAIGAPTNLQIVWR